jgi:hypothetical protein
LQASKYGNIKKAISINGKIQIITIPSDEGINVFPPGGTDQVLPEYQDNLSQELGSVVCRIPDNGFKGIPDKTFKG